jgi:cystathionine beta-lyase
VAKGLRGLVGVGSVHYPGLDDHPGREVHFAQARGAGAVVSFELEDAALVRSFLKAVKLPLVAVSLGGVESILSYPARMSHASMSPTERERRGITDALVRLSVGLESAADLLADMGRALAEARR